MKFSLHNRRNCAFTLLEVIVVFVIITLATFLLLSALRRARSIASPSSCVNNLMQIGIAFRTWDGDCSALFPARFYTNADGTMKFANAAYAYRSFQVMSNEINNPRILLCPQDQTRTAAADWNSGLSGKNISYFVGLDADESAPNVFLSGDRNLTNGTALVNGILNVTTNQPTGWTMERHGGAGNILFSDGSVQSYTTNGLRTALAKTGLPTNRLAMP